MRSRCFFTFWGVLFLSCLAACATRQPEPVSPPPAVVRPAHLPDSIRFAFTARRPHPITHEVDIQASLFNDRADTAFFCSSTCDGDQYQLRYDSTAFLLRPRMFCHASYPLVVPVPPGGRYDFETHVECRSPQTRIRLGFCWLEADRALRARLPDLQLGDMFVSPDSLQMLLWAEAGIL